MRANDVFFAVHALLLTSLTLGQIGIYDRGSQRISTLCKWAVGSTMAFIIVYAGEAADLNESYLLCKHIFAERYVDPHAHLCKYSQI